jgi:hypothetical protein
MTEYLLIILVTFVIIYALIKGCNININISVKQEFSAEDRQLLEDLYNNEGDPKEQFDVNAAFDNLVKSVNDIMLDNNEEA